MHYSQTGDLLSFHEEQGSYAPRDHQRVIAKLTSGLTVLYQEGRISLEPLPETMLDEGQISATPDLILVDAETQQTAIIVEICHIHGLKNDIRKVIRLTEEYDYGILEAFVYNYKTLQWFRYRKGDGGLTTESAYSDILHLNLNSFLE